MHHVGSPGDRLAPCPGGPAVTADRHMDEDRDLDPRDVAGAYDEIDDPPIPVTDSDDDG